MAGNEHLNFYPDEDFTAQQNIETSSLSSRISYQYSQTNIPPQLIQNQPSADVLQTAVENADIYQHFGNHQQIPSNMIIVGDGSHSSQMNFAQPQQIVLAPQNHPGISLSDAVFWAEQLKKPTVLGLLAEHRDDLLRSIHDAIPCFLAGAEKCSGDGSSKRSSIGSLHSGFGLRTSDDFADYHFHPYHQYGGDRGRSFTKSRSNSRASSTSSTMLRRRIRKQKPTEEMLLKEFSGLDAEQTREKIAEFTNPGASFDHLLPESFEAYVSEAKRRSKEREQKKNVSTDENMQIETGSVEGGDGNSGQIQEPNPSSGVEENEENLTLTST